MIHSTALSRTILIISLILCTIIPDSLAQKHHSRYSTIDVLNYQFNITVSDESDLIKGVATVTIKFKKETKAFALDLVSENNNGKGMLVKSIDSEGELMEFEHADNQIRMNVDVAIGEVKKFQITYEGVPADGLIISKNKYGDRTFFGDNWPDRGKNWLPIVDHPSDKSTVEWMITAPSHYQSIGNGLLQERTNISNHLTMSRWKMDTPIPTKVMVIGVAKFAIGKRGAIDEIPISAWVYPQDKEKGFSDYKLAVPIMDYFIGHIGPYPFKKLANVQSKTRFGGMENAGNIFYAERTVKGDGTNESLIAHEVAHQWFGNSASELDWHHIWLSEGFATYFTNLYMEHKYGRDKLVEMVREQKNKIFSYQQKNSVPVVNKSISNYMKLLNANSYQKGGWILHMLRHDLGDELFWEGIRIYYNKFQYSNAYSEDFQEVMEDVSQKDLSIFFNQWLYQPSHPKLSIEWRKKGRNLEISIEQQQKGYVFDFPLEVAIQYVDGSRSIETIAIDKKNTKVELQTDKKIDGIIIDPNEWLLFELIQLKNK